MTFISKSRLTLVTIPCLVVLYAVSLVYAAMDPRFEIDPQALAGTVQSTKSSVKKQTHLTPVRSVKTGSVKNSTYYTVKPGDHLFKILMRDYGLSNSEAEAFIEEIKTENNIRDIKRLKIGQKITIPPVRRQTDGTIKQIQPLHVSSKISDNVETPTGQSFVLESPVPQLSSQDVIGRVRETWNKVVPIKSDLQKPLSLQTSAFSLTLDPQRYPVFSAMDGARILIDQNGSIPPLVKSLIEEKDPTIRIVSDSPAGTKHFMSAILKSAGFYSVEENFSMDFGTDPKLTVNADFKVEKSPDSLIKQDVVLMNSGRIAVPPKLNDFLKKEGFTLYEPFASSKNHVARDSRILHVVSAKKQSEMVDAILSSFSVSPDRDRSLDVFAADNNGISLSVKAERYYERGGQRYVITSFDGDPVNYTLFRILETKGYRVIILEARDDFRKVSEKIISRMKIQGHFALHNLLQDDTSAYSLQMSGFKLDDASFSGGGLFLTNLAMDRIITDLLTENGYRIKDR